MINADADRGRALPLPRAYRRVKPLGARLLPIRVCGATLHSLCTHTAHLGRDQIRPEDETLLDMWAHRSKTGEQALGATPSIHPSIHPFICVQSPQVGTISLLGLLSLLLTAHPWLSFRYIPSAPSYRRFRTVDVMTRWTSSTDRCSRCERCVVRSIQFSGMGISGGRGEGGGGREKGDSIRRKDER